MKSIVSEGKGSLAATVGASGRCGTSSAVKGLAMASDDWRRLADYVVARRVAVGFRDRRALAAATGITERTLGKLENGQRVSASTLGAIENFLGWTPGSCRRILAGGEPTVGSGASDDEESTDPTLQYLADTPSLPPEVVRGLIALAKNWRETAEEQRDDERRQA
jgi:transcriptional regulator with XRE-family HTH domain